jgi:feruloyl esterase
MVRAKAVGFALTLVLPATSVLAQNGYSFLDTEKSAVHYSVAEAKPVMPCAAVTHLSWASTTILSAQTIPAADGVPEHCRVEGMITPEVRFQVNLPAQWNRRFYMHGNGGFAGETPETATRPLVRAAALKNGFATVQTNTGHDLNAEPLASFAADYAKRIDYAFRAVHMTVGEAKKIVSAYYGRPPAYSYWDGCSTGGRQGLISAQRFPEDFDGILAGAPVLNFVDTVTQSLWNGLTLAQTPVSLGKLKTVSDAIYARCDAKDGLKDGIIDDPRRCDFDIKRDVAQCAAGKDDDSCLTAAQAGAIMKIHDGLKVNGKPVLFGYELGSEGVGFNTTAGGKEVSGWSNWLVSPPGDDRKPLQYSFGDSFVRYFSWPKIEPAMDTAKFDFDKDMAKFADARTLLNATDPSLAAFRSRGGRLLMYFGWADTALAPRMGIDYYEKATAANGKDTPEFFRLFMVPGMFHCRGGIGPDRLDGLTALINWVENGTAPQSIVATKMKEGKVVRSRPLCPYPQVARYSGSGSADDAANFACKAPE